MLPRPHDLPGTDPRFHESRNYLSPRMDNGREILASHGSCKEPGCGYRAAWRSNIARDKGMWKHRAEKVVAERIRYFGKRVGNDPEKIRTLVKETADKHTHTFGAWMKLIDDFTQTLAGAGVDDLPDYNFRVEYDLGNHALDVAKAVIDQAYEF